jgi:hypothetical protein
MIHLLVDAMRRYVTRREIKRGKTTLSATLSRESETILEKEIS